jgi:CRP/FNR family transcriptional regulator
MAPQLEFISKVEYFTGLSRTELEAVLQHVHEKKAERGDILVFEGEPSQTLFFVVAGAVKIYKTSADGKEQILQIIRPGESFNDVPLAGGANIATAEAMGEVTLNTIKKSEMTAIIGDYPQVARNTIVILSRQVQRMVALVEDLSFRNVAGRVAKILLEYAGEGGGEKPRLTQQEMAAMIGTAREMVGRSLKTLEEDGLIKLDHHRIIVTNREALKRAAGVS